MPLVEPLAADHDAEVAELATFFNTTLGFPPNSVLTMQRRPEIAKAFTNLNKAVMENHGALTAELKRLIAYLSSLTAGCRYCQAHTMLAAERFGSTPERMADIWTFQDSPHFTDAEKAAFAFAIAASTLPNAVDDEIAAGLHAHWDDDDIVEIVGVVALFGFLNRWNDSMGTTLEPGGEAAGTSQLTDEGWTKGKHI